MCVDDDANDAHATQTSPRSETMMTHRQAIEQRNYHSDSRVLAAHATVHFTVKAVVNSLAIIVLTDHAVESIFEDFDAYKDDPNDPNSYTEDWDALPWLKRDGTYFGKCDQDECYACSGTGTMVNPSIDAGGLTAQDFEDPHFAEMYMAGAFDVPCSTCKGTKLCQEVTIDPERHPELVKWLDEAKRDAYYHDIERAAERRMGA